MRVSHLLVLILVAVVVWQYSKTQSKAPVPPPSEATASPAAEPEPRRKRPAFAIQYANETGASEEQAERWMMDALKRAPRLKFEGKITQHLSTGHLLVNGIVFGKGAQEYNTRIFALFGLPGADNLADGTPLECRVSTLGTYRYTSVSGAAETIRELIFAELPPPTHDRYGRPLSAGSPSLPSPAQPARFVPRPSPTAAEAAAEIQRKYGARP